MIDSHILDRVDKIEIGLYEDLSVLSLSPDLMIAVTWALFHCDGKTPCSKILLKSWLINLQIKVPVLW